MQVDGSLKFLSAKHKRRYFEEYG